MTESQRIHAVSGEQFECFIQEHAIVMLDFWAEWCAPCRQFGKIYEQVAEIYSPKVTFAQVNIEVEAELAETFAIRSIPHLVVLKEGIAIYSEAGSVPKSTLEELVEQAIAADVSKIRLEMNTG